MEATSGPNQEGLKEQKIAFAWSRTTWHATCPNCDTINEVDEGDCMSGSASNHKCVFCGAEFSFRADA